jgi:catechol 2,3-dioxygenase-like lactoylglutathione lyase family enzyme
MPDPRLFAICPVFLVDNIVKTAEWYRDHLGFKFERYWGEPPCFTILHRDNVEIFLKSPECPGDKIMNPNRSRTEAWDAYIRMRDVDALHAELKAKGVQIVRGPEDQEYLMREVEILDMNGYALCFGQDIS